MTSLRLTHLQSLSNMYREVMSGASLPKLGEYLHFWKMPRKWVGKGPTVPVSFRHRKTWKEIGSQDLCACSWVRLAA